MAMNTAKIVTGGLLAGLAFNVGDFLINTVIMAEDNRAMMTRLGLDPASMESASAIVPFVVVDFLLGLLAVWTYAAIRPRFGPGPATAIKAGLVLFLAVTFVIGTFVAIGMLPVDMYLKGTVLSLINAAVGSVIGGWAYSEA